MQFTAHDTNSWAHNPGSGRAGFPWQNLNMGGIAMKNSSRFLNPHGKLKKMLKERNESLKNNPHWKLNMHHDFKVIQKMFSALEHVAHKYFPDEKRECSPEDKMFGQDRVRWEANIYLWDDGDFRICYVHGDKENLLHEFSYHDSKNEFVYRVLRSGASDEDQLLKEENLFFEKF
jgi:hypothetical protein